MTEVNYSRTIIKVSIVTIVLNLFLLVAKLFIGISFDNLAVISDGIDTAGDVLINSVIIATVFLSSAKADTEHNYGHEKTESIVTLLLSVLLATTAVFLVVRGIGGIITPKDASVNAYLIGVTVSSVIIKESIFWYKIYHAKKIKSDILRADAWNSRTDCLSSIAVIIGLVLSIFVGSNIFESIAVLVVSGFIFRVAFGVFWRAAGQLRDRAADRQSVQKIRYTALAISGVEGVDVLKTRCFGNSIFVDIEIAVNGDMSVYKSHQIAEQVHDAIENLQDVAVKHCTVHVNPCLSSQPNWELE